MGATMENLLSLVILLHVGCAGACRCRSFCTSCMSSSWVFQLPPTAKRTPLSKERSSQHLMTVVSWCTYPVVYLFPMLGINAAHAVVAIQIGYCASDIISKCGVGLLIYQITYA